MVESYSGLGSMSGTRRCRVGDKADYEFENVRALRIYVIIYITNIVCVGQVSQEILLGISWSAPLLVGLPCILITLNTLYYFLL